MHISPSRSLKISAILGLALAFTGAARADFVANGNFETGNFSGWDLLGDSDGAFVSGSPGSFAAALTTSTANVQLNQTLALVSGQSYSIDFSVAGDGATPNTFTAILGGTTLVASTTIPGPPTTFANYHFTYIATSASTLLSFTVRDDPGYVYVTNVSVNANAVPEPSTIVLLGLGGVALVGRRHLRKANRAASA